MPNLDTLIESLLLSIAALKDHEGKQLYVRLDQTLEAYKFLV
jgi:hypothetical protein